MHSFFVEFENESPRDQCSLWSHDGFKCVPECIDDHFDSSTYGVVDIRSDEDDLVDISKVLFLGKYYPKRVFTYNSR